MRNGHGRRVDGRNGRQPVLPLMVRVLQTEPHEGPLGSMSRPISTSVPEALMGPRITRNVLTAVAAVLGVTGCDHPTGPSPRADLVPALPLPVQGTLAVATLTTGSSIPSGYTITVDNSQSQPIAPTGLATFTGLAAGTHAVLLGGVAPNCTLQGQNPQTVTLVADVVGSATFTLSCAPAGNLTVSATTTGSSLPTGYTVTVDGSLSQPIAANGSVTFTSLTAGNHSVALSGVPTNCTVNGANPQTANVPAGGTASMTFTVTCAATTGTGVRITGQGQIGSGSPTPGSDVQTFNFDVRSDLTGSLLYTEYAFVYPDGSPGTLTVNANDPATGIQAFRTSSNVCGDPSRGAEFDGIGRLHDGSLASFTVAACDNGPAGSGQDFFNLTIPSIGESRSGFLTEGDIAKSGS